MVERNAEIKRLTRSETLTTPVSHCMIRLNVISGKGRVARGVAMENIPPINIENFFFSRFLPFKDTCNCLTFTTRC